MSRLIVITRPSILPGYLLAGVEGYAAENPAAAEELIGRLLEEDELALLAVDEEYLAQIDPAVRRQLDKSRLLYLPLPTGEPLPDEDSGRTRIVELIRQAIGFHITFQGQSSR